MDQLFPKDDGTFSTFGRTCCYSSGSASYRGFSMWCKLLPHVIPTVLPLQPFEALGKWSVGATACMEVTIAWCNITWGLMLFFWGLKHFGCCVVCKDLARILVFVTLLSCRSLRMDFYMSGIWSSSSCSFFYLFCSWLSFGLKFSQVLQLVQLSFFCIGCVHDSPPKSLTALSFISSGIFWYSNGQISHDNMDHRQCLQTVEGCFFGVNIPTLCSAVVPKSGSPG